MPKVVYRVADTAQYAGRRVLVVGGGDSALEAAAKVAEQTGTSVTLCYRGKAFDRARPINRGQVAAAVEAGRITLFLEAHVLRIDPEWVSLETQNGPVTLANDDVIVCAGGVLAGDFLRSIGIQTEMKYGTS